MMLLGVTWDNKGLDTASVSCKCSMNVLGGIVSFATSLAMKGEEGLQQVGTLGGFSQGGGARVPLGVREEDRAGKEMVGVLERARWG